MSKTQSNDKKKKKIYQPPKISDLGKIQEISRTDSHGGAGDAITGLMKCLTVPSHLEEHNYLISDASAQAQFYAQIQKHVRPGDVVLDLGAGTGIHSLFALKAGAKKVYAVDSGDVIELARQVIENNNYKDKVEFIFGNSTEIDLPEKVDVIISNIGFLNLVKYLPDAVTRFLKPGGKCIPSNYQLSLVPITDKNRFESQVNFWRKNHYGFDFSAFDSLSTNLPHYFHADPENFLADPINATLMSFAQSADNGISWEFEYTSRKSDFLHGIAGWYTFLSGEDEMFSTRPPLQISKLLWSNYFFPIPNPTQVKPGDKIKLELKMTAVEKIDSLIWNWVLKVNENTIANQTNMRSFLPLDTSIRWAKH